MTGLFADAQPFTLPRHLSPSPLHLLSITRPIQRQDSFLHVSMEGRPAPIGHPLDMAVLARVVVDVVHMTGKILVVADAMFPETALPDAPFPLALAAARKRFCTGQRAGKAALDQAPAEGVVGVLRWQCAQGVEVFREDDDGVDTPGMTSHHSAEAGAQQVDVIGEQAGAAVGEVEREKPGRTRCEITTVVGHRLASLPENGGVPSYERLALSVSREGDRCVLKFCG